MRVENDGRQNKNRNFTILRALACYIAVLKLLKRMNVRGGEKKSTCKSSEWQYLGTGSYTWAEMNGTKEAKNES